ncbi:MAG: FkbM family methyltransferase [Gloeomargaritaceae cyanobacterium C42_A2020_066]|nr:FkbM family methyltransferase [Gloeomargaritaceae cyanobacterium C42_A2020_066]
MSTLTAILKERNRLEGCQFTVCVVGSRKIRPDDDLGTQGWSVLGSNLTILGFDADPEATAAANLDLEARQVSWQESHYDLALGRQTGEAKLYVTRSVDCSSLYLPNEQLSQRLQGFSQSLNVDLVIDIPVISLDDFCEQEGVDQIDFLYLDIQGAELDVLQGGSQALEKILGIEAEVEFSPLYQNQPLFADVDTYLRNQGFSLFDLSTDHPWSRAPRACSPLRTRKRPGQLLWADALYLRDLCQQNLPQNADPLAILKLACIADILGCLDYALELLRHLTLTHGAAPRFNVADDVLYLLNTYPDLVAHGLDTLPLVQDLQPFLKD